MLFRRYLVLIAAILICGLVFSLSNPTFLTVRNLGNILIQAVPILLIAFGMTIVLISAGIDLSVGSVAALVAVSTVSLIEVLGVPVPVALGLGLLLGVGTGVGNGLVVTRLSMPDFIATLGTLSLFRGLAFIASGGHAIRSTDPLLAFLANGHVGPVPTPLVIAAVALIGTHLLLSQTQIGRSFYAVGGNRVAARLAGVNVGRSTVVAYALSGGLAAAAGLVAASRTAAGAPTAAQGWELLAVAIAVLGGTNLFGGYGAILGTLLAGILIGMINNWMSLTGLAWWLQGLVLGSLLIAVVAVGQRQRQQSTRAAFGPVSGAGAGGVATGG